jgi:hypothetical protein
VSTIVTRERFRGPWWLGDLCLDIEIVDERCVLLWIELGKMRLTIGSA